MRAPKATKTLAARLVVVALVVVPGLLAAPNALAHPTKADVDRAKAQLASLQNQLDVLVEQYDQAQVRLQRSEAHLADARAAVQRADAAAHAARTDLSRRAAAAYEGTGSTLGFLLGATSLSQFSDTVEFLDQIGASDADAVTRAEVTGQNATWASEQLRKAVAARTAIVDSLRQQRSDIEGKIAEQRTLVSKLEAALHRALVRRPKPGPLAPGGGGTTFKPPPASSKAGIAVAAARSVIGTPYVYAGSSPQTGFDCSGLTMWSWAQAGVSLPHSAAMQYAMLPHVSQSDLQPGDLVFFYSPIHHVGIYVGGGMMIHAPHTGAYVEEVPVEWQNYVGAGRPG